MLRCPPKRFAQVILTFMIAACEVLAHSSVIFVQTRSDEQPVYTNYKGVEIGMSADDVRKKLGEPSDQSNSQDYYEFSPDETAQVNYDASGLMTAISVTYFKASDAPTAKKILGIDVEPQYNGNVYRMIKYPKAGYWVSYSRTEGDPPVVTVTMSKLDPNKPS